MSNPIKIAIRADGNQQLGMGHVMRCLSIANALRGLGADCIWVTAEPEICTYVADSGFDCILTGVDFRDMNAELPLWRKLNPKVILADSYQVTPEYLSALKNISTLFYLDDNFRFVYPADFIVNYNFHAGTFNYTAHYRHKQLFLGSLYVPLREEFQVIPPPIISPELSHVLLTTGSSDPLNIIPALLPILALKYPEITFHIVIGRFFSTTDHLKSLPHPNIELHENVRHMSELMTICDCAISASGSTLYELCACGLPAIVFEIADNQIGLSDVPGACGAVIPIGLWSHDSSPAKVLRSIPFSRKDRLFMSNAASRLVDGQGASRIATRLLEHC